MPRMTDRVYLSDDGRSGYHTCGPTPSPAVVDRYFVKHTCDLHWMPPLILIVYGWLDRGIQSATEMLPLKRGRQCCIVLNAPPAFVDMHLADTLVIFSVYRKSRIFRILKFFVNLCGGLNSLYCLIDYGRWPVISATAEASYDTCSLQLSRKVVSFVCVSVVCYCQL